MSVRRMTRERWNHRSTRAISMTYRAPRYTLPTGITFDSVLGFVGTAVDTTYAEPASKVIITDQGSAAANTAAIQAAIDAAAVASTGGTLIQIPAGSSLNGITLRARSGDGDYIYIASSGRSLLPLAQAGNQPGDSSTRVDPSDAAHMFKIVNEVSAGHAVNVEAGAHHYRLVGMEATTDDAVACFNLVYLTLDDPGMATEANFPHHIGLDRCYLHGSLVRLDMNRAVWLDVDNGFVVGCDIRDVMNNGADAQGVLMGRAHGPHKICNNYISATGENIMCGGVDAEVAGVITSDIEIRRNFCPKPLTWNPFDPSWDGILRDIKNTFELKNAKRVLFEGNVGLNDWVGAGQQEYMVLIKTTNQGGGATWVETQDITVCYNKLLNCYGGFSLAGHPEVFDVGAFTNRVDIYDNLVVHGDPTLLNDGSVNGGFMAQFTAVAISAMGPAIAFRHNTCPGNNQNDVFFTGSPASPDVDLSNNLFRRTTQWGGTAHGIKGDGTIPPNPANDGADVVDVYVTTPTFGGNGFYDSAGGTTQQRASYAGNTLIDDAESAVFADPTGGDYHLVNAALFGTATDGSDPGANIDLLDLETAGAQ